MLFHLRDGELSDVEEAVDIDAHHGGIVGLRVLGERLGDEDSCIVDQGVDATKPGKTFSDHTLRCCALANIAGNDKNIGITRRPDRACGRDHAVIAIAVGFDQSGANPL